MLTLKLYRGKASLTSKLSVLVTVTVLLVIVVLGLYFDSFLRESFLNTTQKRMQHGYERIAYNLNNVELALRNGLSFAKTDQGLIASIELINNYQDKNNYNTFLIDEEKKAIASELLNKVKLSFNDDIAIYDKNEELVAFVTKHGESYRAYYISFKDGVQELFSRYEEQDEYSKAQLPLPNSLTLSHASYYDTKQVYNESIITYQNLNELLTIKSHQNLIDPDNGRVIAHLEMSKIIGNDYLDNISKALDIDIQISFNTDHHAMALPFGEGLIVPSTVIHQSDDEYISVMRQNTTTDSHAYIVSRLNKIEHNLVLNENRQRFLLILVLLAVTTLLLMRFLITYGLARPLGFLMGQINKIERQNYSNSKTLVTGDELETISTSINQLAMTVSQREHSLQESRKELQFLSYHDSLTNLPNRRFFEDRLNHSIELAKRSHRRMALLFLDLDQFKMVNDTLGHDVGDELLILVAERLHENIRSADTLARLGGDEFNILLETSDKIEEIETIVKKYLKLFRQPFCCRDTEINVTASIGVSVYPDDGSDSITLIKHADLALYNTKDSGRNGFSFFSNDLSDKIQERAKVIQALQKAIDEGDQFELHYQPKVSLHSGQIEAVEALIRWHSPDYGFVQPARFIPLAEETGLIVPIGKWVLEQACRDYMLLLDEGINLKHISLNVSNVQMRHENMLSMVRQVIDMSGIKPEALELEITESYIATDVETAITALRNFRSMGISLSIDDFGTGYSSMSYLKRLPVTRVKIDKSFVDGLPHDKDSGALTKAIISLAQNFDLQVTAEGVERVEQLEFLKSQDCDEIQGYYFSKPLSLSDFRSFYRNKTRKDNVILLESLGDK